MSEIVKFIKLFLRNFIYLRLMPYYNGLTNLEAIIYYEQLNRSELITFLDKFKDVLMVSTYEDPNPLVRLSVKMN